LHVRIAGHQHKPVSTLVVQQQAVASIALFMGLLRINHYSASHAIFLRVRMSPCWLHGCGCAAGIVVRQRIYPSLAFDWPIHVFCIISRHQLLAACACTFQFADNGGASAYHTMFHQEFITKLLLSPALSSIWHKPLHAPASMPSAWTYCCQ